MSRTEVLAVQPLWPDDPAELGPFRLVGRLGSGGMGQVFLGRAEYGRLAAVKMVHPGLVGDPGFRARFAHEIAVAQRVHGRWVAGIVDADPAARVPWLATEFVSGPSLAHAVEATGPLPESSVRPLAGRLAEAVAEVHAAGVVHRDLKPSNVVLADDGPRVIDFGISRAVDATSVSRAGVVVGPPGFMSPEQATGEPAGPASDVFSLAGVLVFAATGVGPFGRTENAIAMLLRISDRDPELAALPDWLRAVLEPCFAKDPGQRPTSRELVAQLAEVPPVAGGNGWLPAEVSALRPTLQEPQTPAPPPPTEAPPPHVLPPPPARPPRADPAGPPAALPGHRVDLPESPAGSRPWMRAVVIGAVVLVGLLGWLIWPSRTAGPPQGPTAVGPPTTAKPISTLRVGATPVDVAVYADGKRAYVQIAHGIAVLDTATNAVVVNIQLPGIPEGLVLSPDGQRLYVSLFGGFLVVIDTATNASLASIPTGGYANGLAVSPDGRRAYVSSNGEDEDVRNDSDNVILVVDIPANAVIARIPAPGAHDVMGIAPDGSRVYVDGEGTKSTLVLDTATNTMSAPIPVTRPVSVVWSGERGYLVGDGGVRVLDRAGGTLGSIRLDEGGILSDAAVTPDGRRLYVASSLRAGESGVLLAIDTSTHFVIERIPLNGGPSGIALTPDGGRLYVSSQLTDSVMIVDLNR